ncbi:MAG: hypothetical protein CVV24_14065 [Ignavibacteriae bacterium HGW-Ignavibacteriae-3]|nr:MAG: hypothetical protein CVV24_14065 [Ignavibacteriae bacterium HGW-Ignavibacteriae-3]
MEAYQIILLFFILLILFFRIKKYIASRSVTNYSSVEVRKMIKDNSGIVLMDVRTEKERKSGSIKPSIHLPLHEISIKSDQLKKYKSREIICYCQTGSRSISAAIKLQKMGFDAANMKGGYIKW